MSGRCLDILLRPDRKFGNRPICGGRRLMDLRRIRGLAGRGRLPLMQTRYGRRGWTGGRRLLQHGQRNAFRSTNAIVAAATGGGWLDMMMMRRRRWRRRCRWQWRQGRTIQACNLANIRKREDLCIFRVRGGTEIQTYSVHVIIIIQSVFDTLFSENI